MASAGQVLLDIEPVGFNREEKVQPQIETMNNNALLSKYHYSDAIMSARVSQITCVSIAYSTVFSGADQRKHQSSASLVFVRESTGDQWIPPTKGQ